MKSVYFTVVVSEFIRLVWFYSCAHIKCGAQSQTVGTFSPEPEVRPKFDSLSSLHPLHHRHAACVDFVSHFVFVLHRGVKNKKCASDHR